MIELLKRFGGHVFQPLISAIAEVIEIIKMANFAVHLFKGPDVVSKFEIGLDYWDGLNVWGLGDFGGVHGERGLVGGLGGWLGGGRLGLGGGLGLGGEVGGGLDNGAGRGGLGLAGGAHR